MTKITLEEDIARSAEILGSLQDTVRELRRQVENMAAQAKEGNTLDETALKKTLTQVSGMIGHCAKAENTLNECRRQQAGIARGGYALDLGKARADIGCKLDRLRRCCGPDPISG